VKKQKKNHQVNHQKGLKALQIGVKGYSPTGYQATNLKPLKTLLKPIGKALKSGVFSSPILSQYFATFYKKNHPKNHQCLNIISYY
jgi:hypothetical protein